jgi:hypothetical protein
VRSRAQQRPHYDRLIDQVTESIRIVTEMRINVLMLALAGLIA